MVLSWMLCIYVTESRMVQVWGLGLTSLFVYRIVAGPAQLCTWLLAIWGFLCGAEEVATHDRRSEPFHRTPLVRPEQTVRQYELPLHPGLCDVACAQPWAMVLPSSPLRTSSLLQETELQPVPPLEDQPTQTSFHGPSEAEHTLVR